MRMNRLLHIIGSPRGPRSTSRAITEAFVDRYRTLHPDDEVDTLDLWADPIPTFDGDRVAAKMTVIGGGSVDGAQATAWESITEVFQRFDAADRYVFGVPMWNGSVPWVLKQLIDTITQPGMIFAFDSVAGYTGLLNGKKALAVYTSGVYSPGVPSAFGRDFHATWFDDWLRFAGITDIAEVRYQPTLLTETPDRDLAVALDEARRLAVTF
jgi:FMN-dependent NADH-azoreductase